METSFAKLVGGTVIFYINDCELSEHGTLEKAMTKKLMPSRDGQENLFQDWLKQTYGTAGLVEYQRGREENG